MAAAGRPDRSTHAVGEAPNEAWGTTDGWSWKAGCDWMDPATVHASVTFEIFHEHYRRWVLRLARSWTRNTQDAEDVSQAAFLYVWKRGRLPTNRLQGDPRALLRKVIRNLSAEARRQSERTPTAVVTPEHPERPAGDAAAPDSSDVTNVLAHLSSRQREIVRALILQELSVSDTARHMGLTSGSVRSAVCRAIQRIRTMIGSRASRK